MADFILVKYMYVQLKSINAWVHYVPAFFQKLYLIRFSVVAILFLALFPIATVSSSKATAFFGGLFDLDSRWTMFWATTTAYLLAWNALVTMRITLMYGPERCGFGTPKETRWMWTGRWVPWILFITGLLIPIPFLQASLANVKSWDIYFGALLGFFAALFIVFVADFFQRLFNSFSGVRQADPARAAP